MKNILTKLTQFITKPFLKTKKSQPVHFANYESDTMQGAGVKLDKGEYVTHSTLHHTQSAIKSFITEQKIFLFLLLILILEGFFWNFLLTVQIIIGVLSVIYLFDVIFNSFIVLKSLKFSKEIKVGEEELEAIDEKSLPTYTILCPLYKEINVLPQFLEAMSKLDYPKDKLQIILLFEEDDKETIEEVKKILVPGYFKGAIVPYSLPKTKPKACNYGLSHATGEYLVIYDAEDVPDPLQLKKAVLGFQKVDKNVICLQAKLNYYNKNQNLLTRLFTAEYSLWFDIILTGLQSINSIIPLGGTSNHFRTADLKALKGWDAFNVTEDADLGLRLFKQGYKTEILDSVTLEEANSDFHNWLRQRSRWIKGYLQTYLVHTRDLFKMENTSRIHQFIFHFLIGGKMAFIYINPILWLATIAYFVLNPIVGPTIQMLYPAPVLYLALPSLVIGNFLFIVFYMIGCAKREEWSLIKYVLFVPIYWLMISLAAVIALFQLFFKPHFWEKTVHGLHLAKVPPLRPDFANASSGKQGFEGRARVSRAFSFSTWKVSYFAIFLLLDLILAKLFLSPTDANTYILLSVFVKGITIAAQCIVFILNKHKLYTLIFLTFLVQWINFVIFGIKGSVTLPALFNKTLDGVTAYSTFYLFAYICFAIGNVFVFYYLRRKKPVFAVTSALIALLQIVIFPSFAGNLRGIIIGITYLATINLMTMVFLHIDKGLRKIIGNNINSFLNIFKKTSADKSLGKNKLRILIFNWRDTRHKFAGGAETYIHQLAKRFVKDGNKVTLFSGNDNASSVNEAIDGVEIVRRGGTYTVYIFALLYYLFKFRGKYDIIVDCENGIPFFTPLYSRLPKLLIVHHVHQEVFREHLVLPLALFAQFLESKLMPIIYSNTQIVTISESSKQEILKLGLGKKSEISIINPGVDIDKYAKMKKTLNPSFIYLGRLQAYKNIDIAIKAFSKVHAKFPNATLTIAGSGESLEHLKMTAKRFNLEESVLFTGKVSEENKKTLLAKSWVALQPSMMEGFGITTIEANACGTPVIASNVNGLKDSVVDGETGILVKVKDVESLSKAMLSCITNHDLRQSLSENAYHWSKNFSWDKSANNLYIEIVKQLRGNYELNKLYI